MPFLTASQTVRKSKYDIVLESYHVSLHDTWQLHATTRSVTIFFNSQYTYQFPQPPALWVLRKVLAFFPEV